MRRILLAMLLLGTSPVWADEGSVAPEPFFGTEKAAAVLNAPGVALNVGKAATNIFEPGVEHLYDIDGEWRTGVSMAIYTYSRNDLPLVSLRAGYIVDYAPYISVPIQFQNIAKRWTPDSADKVLDAVGKYAIIGPFIGYNIDKQEDGNQNDGGLIYGASVGAKLSF